MFEIGRGIVCERGGTETTARNTEKRASRLVFLSLFPKVFFKKIILFKIILKRLEKYTRVLLEGAKTRRKTKKTA